MNNTISRSRKKTLLLPIAFMVLGSSSCVLNSHMSPAKNARMDELWIAPTDLASRDLYNGQFGAKNAPDPNERFEVTSVKTSGTQPGYDVKDSKGREFSVKLGVEPRVEVTVSRILAAIGFHQPAVYYVPKWTRMQDGKAIVEGPARFRLEPDTHEKVGDWPWRDNPFVGTQPLAGLFTFMVMFNNWDIKAAQNALYKVTDEGDGPRTWYVVRDLGASLGKTAWLNKASKDDTVSFLAEQFIERVENNRVHFHYDGAWLEPKVHSIVTPADVRWLCNLMAQLTDTQWRDAFRAGAFTDREAELYIGRLKEKIAEGQRVSWY